MTPESDIHQDSLLPATPEETWAAITTGTGGWLWPITVQPTVNGTVDGFGGNDTVTVWEPDHRLTTRADGEDGWFNELDFRIEPRGNETLLAYRHRTVFLDDFENQYDACRQHTAFYHHTLGEYLTHFKGAAATYISADGPEASGFDQVRDALGVTDTTKQGDTVKCDVPGVDTVEAVVDYLTPAFIGLRTDDALLRFYGRDAFGWPVGLAHHLFGETDAEKANKAWENWLTALYA